MRTMIRSLVAATVLSILAVLPLATPAAAEEDRSCVAEYRYQVDYVHGNANYFFFPDPTFGTLYLAYQTQDFAVCLATQPIT